MKAEAFYSGPTPLSYEQAIFAIQGLGVTRRTAATALRCSVHSRRSADLYHGGKRYRINRLYNGGSLPMTRRVTDHQYVIAEV